MLFINGLYNQLSTGASEYLKIICVTEDSKTAISNWISNC